MGTDILLKKSLSRFLKLHIFSIFGLEIRINMPETVLNIATPPYNPSIPGIIETTTINNFMNNNFQTTIPQYAPPSYEEVISSAIS